MHPHVRTALLVAVLLAVAGYAWSARGTGAAAGGAHGEPGGAVYRLDEGAAHDAHARWLAPEIRQATFTFGPEVQQLDRQAVVDAVARARPEAQRLVGLVDGLVDIRVGSAGAGAAGVTMVGGPRYPVTLDLGGVLRRSGQRGIDRLVLHELGHVIDSAIVTDDVMRPLVAAVPMGYGCPADNVGACTAPEERFAESFAKWATGDIGVNLYLGYAVPPPEPSLETWGLPLARLAAGT